MMDKLDPVFKIDFERQIPKLKSDRLAGVYEGELRLLTKNCACVITPAGDYVARENSGGQLERWVLKQLQISDNCVPQMLAGQQTGSDEFERWVTRDALPVLWNASEI